MRGGIEMHPDRLCIEREVRRRYHRDSSRSMARRMLGESHGVTGRLRTAVHHDGEPVVSGGHEFIGREPPLVDGEEDSLAGGAEREETVETCPGVEVHHSADPVAVDGPVTR